MAILIQGGDLNGSISFRVPGYKHATNVLICASICRPCEVLLTNVPDISDTRVLVSLINVLGGYASLKKNTLLLDSRSISRWQLPRSLTMLSHASVYLLPVILGRLGNIFLGDTGGCMIGNKEDENKRPMRHMLQVLEAFNGSFRASVNGITGETPGFHPAEIDISDYSISKDMLTGPMISGATKTALLAALCVGRGKTRILNPYLKPDVTELIVFSQKAGMHIRSAADEIEICANGYKSQVEHELIADISQIMTYITIAVYCETTVTIENIDTDKVREGLKNELVHLAQMNINLIWQCNSLVIPRQQDIKSIDIRVTSTSIYSDHQPFFALMLSKADGNSRITEWVWKDRFEFAHELNKLAGREQFVVNGNSLTVTPGNLKQSGMSLYAKDLRSAAVLTIAALKVPGFTILENIHHLQRGYEHLPEDLISCGGKVFQIDHS